jgi:sarcosine oxidase
VTGRADVIVAGLGAMGSMASLALARRGRKVIGLDARHPPHTLGSSHGRSRIIREAYYESPAYVPLVQRAYQGWAALERDSGQALFRRTGGLMIGPPDGTLVRGARESAERHRLPFELLESDAIRRRFTAFAPEPGTVGLLEPRAGILFPEACIAAALRRAAAVGADLRLDQEVTGWSGGAGPIRVETTSGTLTADRLVLAVGPWLVPRLAGLDLGLVTERQVACWLDTEGRPEFGADRMPVFIWEWAMERFFYGLPDTGDGLKLARHHEGASVAAATVDRAVSAADIEPVLGLAARHLPGASPRIRESAVCLYTNTRDRHFVLGAHPAEPRVILVSPCSGHGFKFASAIGDVVADLVIEGHTRFDLTPFQPSRLLASS